jgi:hypothetical protein
MPDNTITINESYLLDRIRNYTDYENESDDRLQSFLWQPVAGGSVQGNLSVELPLKLGAASFSPASDLVTNAGAVRTNFLTRMTAFNEQSGFLRNGLQSLLDNSETIESLNTMTADEFGSYVDETSSGSSSSGPAPAPGA